MEAFELLQVVTPTDADHGAAWWNEPYGLEAKKAQQEYIDQLKQNCADNKVDKKEDLNTAISATMLIWPKHEYGFYKDGFGRTILHAWDTMFEKFVRYVNSLH